MSAPTDQTSPEPKPEPPTEPSQAGPADPAEATAPDSLATASAAPRATDASGSSDDVITPDILGEPWVARRIPVTESPTKAPGADHAVLAGPACPRSLSEGAPWRSSSRAVAGSTTTCVARPEARAA